jgi:hypothetical protein
MRRPKPVYILVSLFVASFAIIGMLAFLSKKSIVKKNGFNRRLLSSTLTPRKLITLPVKVVKLIGIQSGKIFFQEDNPAEILSTNLSLDSLQTIKINISPDKRPGSSVRMFMQGHQVYVANRNAPAIVAYDLETGKSYSHVLHNYFNQETILSTDQFILRAKDVTSQSHRFVKLDLTKKDTMREDHFSDRKVIGGFQTAGMLYYDTAIKQACYSYFYQNGFICMDTNLNLKLKARTIDTITQREIKVARVASSLTMKQPPPFVNSTGSVFAGKLFLQSMLKADNEFDLDFNENSVVDVYSLTTGSYKGSFYIPAYEGKKAQQFHVSEKKLYALYGKTVVLYDINFIEDL